jgi:hypothetical protein
LTLWFTCSFDYLVLVLWFTCCLDYLVKQDSQGSR